MRASEGTYVLDVAEVMELERRIEAAGTPMVDLMRKAGSAVARAVKEELACLVASACEIDSEGSEAKRDEAPLRQKVVVFAGGGNNGGDGWVVADLLAKDGYAVDLVSTMKASEIKAEPARFEALHVSAAAQVQVLAEQASRAQGCINIHVAPTTEEVRALLRDAAVVVDALLGIGFKGESVREPVASWIAEINTAAEITNAVSDTVVAVETAATAKAAAVAKTADMAETVPAISPRSLRVIAVDVPSGLNAQTGAAASTCVKAHKTVTMLAYKPGLLEECAQPFVGELRCDELGVEVGKYL